MPLNTCCIVPMYNEGQVISQVVTGLRTVFPSVLCVDDGSTDDSAARAKEAGAMVLRHAVNIGQGAALSTGFNWVQHQHLFRNIVTFDADGQHRPEDAFRLIEELERKQLDLVFASRFLGQDQSHIPLTKRIILKGVTKLNPSLLGSPSLSVTFKYLP